MNNYYQEDNSQNFHNSMNEHEFNNFNNQYKKPCRKTGPAPKYGENQSKKMVSMRLTPDALATIKNACTLLNI